MVETDNWDYDEPDKDSFRRPPIEIDPNCEHEKEWAAMRLRKQEREKDQPWSKTSKNYIGDGNLWRGRKAALTSDEFDALKLRIKAENYDVSKVLDWSNSCLQGPQYLKTYLDEPTTDLLKFKNDALNPHILKSNSSSRHDFSLKECRENPELLVEPTRVGDIMSWEKRLTLFVAREKAGKSHICNMEAISVMRTGKKVMWVSSDECLNDIVRRMDKQVRHRVGNVDENGDDIGNNFIIEHMPNNITDMSIDIATHTPALIIVDSLSSVFATLGIKINEHSDGEKWHACVNNWREFAEKYGCAVILIHHAGKGGKEGRGSRGSRGSTGIAAAVDMIVEASRKSPKDVINILEFSGRLATPVTIYVKFEGIDEGTIIVEDSLDTDLVVVALRDYLKSRPNFTATAAECFDAMASLPSKYSRYKVRSAKNFLGIISKGRGTPWTLPQEQLTTSEDV